MPLVVDVGDITEGRALGEGGQGRVAEVLSVSGHAVRDVVSKRYLPAVRIDAPALTRLVSWRRSLDPAQRVVIDSVTCWPCSVLVSANSVVGTLLPLVPDEFTFTATLPSGMRSQVLRELQFLIAKPELLVRRAVPDPSTAARLNWLARFVEVVTVMHAHGLVLGDLSMKNLLWSLNNGVYLLDCDGLRLGGTNPAAPQPNSPGWDDPSFPGTQNKQSDIYKMALVVLRVLARDFHSRDPERAAPGLGRELLPLLRAGLHPQPALRPVAAAWCDPLRRRAVELMEDVIT